MGIYFAEIRAIEGVLTWLIVLPMQPSDSAKPTSDHLGM